MRNKTRLHCIVCATFAAASVTAQTYTLENDALGRTITVTPEGRLSTSRIVNKLAKRTAVPTPGSDEFRLRFSQGTDKPETAFTITARDCTVAAGYLYGRSLAADEPYATHPAVLGVADAPAFVSDAFYDYIDRTRARPFRLQGKDKAVVQGNLVHIIRPDGRLSIEGRYTAT